MIEYEYSSVVDSLTPYIDYCKENQYEKTSDNFQIRELYKNKNNIIARITTVIKNGKESTVLDFKDGDNSDLILKVSRESIPLVVTDQNRDAIDSILEILGYKKDKVLKRNRVVYESENVKFELDHYLEPVEQFVAAIEGDKEQVDIVYACLERLKETL